MADLALRELQAKVAVAGPASHIPLCAILWFVPFMRGHGVRFFSPSPAWNVIPPGTTRTTNCFEDEGLINVPHCGQCFLKGQCEPPMFCDNNLKICRKGDDVKQCHKTALAEGYKTASCVGACVLEEYPFCADGWPTEACGPSL